MTDLTVVPDSKEVDPIETLRKAQEQRIRDFAQELQALQTKYGCSVVSVPKLVSDGRDGWTIVTNVQIALSK